MDDGRPSRKGGTGTKDERTVTCFCVRASRAGRNERTSFICCKKRGRPRIKCGTGV